MKYIVYLTTNLVNNKIYVGVHKTENPSVFDGYIGCGVIITRPYTYKRAKAPFHFAVEKYGVNNFKRITLSEFDTELEAYELESEIVNETFVKRKDTYNVALGGGHPPLTNKIIYQYSMNGDFIKEWNSIIDAEKAMGYKGDFLSYAVKNKRMGKGFLWTDYKVDKINIDEFSDYNTNRNVYCYSELGTYFETFTSITIAAKHFNTTTSNVQRAIKGGYKIQGNYFSEELYPIFNKPEKISVKNTNIHQYNLLGEYIESYNSISDVCKIFGSGATSGVLTSIRLGRAYKDFQWSIDKVDFMKQLIPDKPKKRKVGQYTLDEILIKEFDTVTACKKEFGQGVDKVLKGFYQQTKGFIFKYLD